LWKETHSHRSATAGSTFVARRAVELDPHLALAYANRGLARLRRGEDYTAKKDFRLCLKLDLKLKQEIEALSVVAKKQRDRKP
jgi:Flp pilus assembly protein TadD